ncbi:uncharacterized protein PGTG_09701 [Puccinia graminis f. sp. tritici CRL 75-36-700-3]|uniref:Cytochrome P450-dit2 n=1 Tax=Puccinia graminis f. sp. tritici (strain CRL 75-36-700-3 / race SCCL) TaxID=418459 RepID=E3KI63_PUCGT|nr:uncharacterized protein PGTG_09701 [Puccinia graminis f. sp. tritici CRL 75-36-700-3]EFP83988.2 hypothetical protein PGTG_09701 [Puccinia graminis f. sp. tritici CRL 75-36-700-3]
MSSYVSGKLVVCGLLYLIYLLIKYRDRAIGTSKRKDPSFTELPGWPLLGQLPNMLKSRSRILEASTMTSLKVGPGFSFTIPGNRVIDISKPEWLEYVQKTNVKNYAKGPLRKDIMLDVLGRGIFVVDDALWKRARHATVSIFTPSTFKTIISPSVNQSIDGLTQVLCSAHKENRTVDICDLFFRFTLDSFIRMTFGKDLGILGAEYGSHSESSAPEFARAFDVAQDQLDFRLAMVVGWELIERLNVRSMGQRMKESCRILDEFVYSLIDERLANLSHKSDFQDQDPSHPDLLSLFITTRDERGGGLTRTELRDTAMNLIIAGRDTTAQALSWAFFHLLMNKELVSKIRKETIEVLGGDQESVTYDNYKRFVWPQAVLHETLRLHPSVPKNAIVALSDDKIPGGPTIEAGNLIRWSDWQMGRDPSVWGADCGEFKPERWIDEAGSIRQFGQFKFHAFNGGPRVCLGINLAIFEAVKVMVEVLRDFELEFAEGWLENVPKSVTIDGLTSQYQTPMYKSSITLPMENPMMIAVKRR